MMHKRHWYLSLPMTTWAPRGNRAPAVAVMRYTNAPTVVQVRLENEADPGRLYVLKMALEDARALRDTLTEHLEQDERTVTRAT